MRKQLTKEHKDKIRQTCLKNQINKGERNGNWKNGVTIQKYYCEICKKIISYRAFKYGTKKCYICSHKGLKHSEETKIKISKGNLGEKNGNYTTGIKNKKTYCVDCGKRLKNNYSKRCKVHSAIERAKRPEEKQRRSLQMLGKNNPMYGKLPKYGKIGKYKLTDFRSFYELNFARFLTCSHINWRYESKTFDLGNTTYTPDFYLPEFNTYIEIKGIWMGDAKKKFKKFKRNYHNIDIKIINQKKLNQIGVII